MPDLPPRPVAKGPVGGITILSEVSWVRWAACWKLKKPWCGSSDWRLDESYAANGKGNEGQSEGTQKWTEAFRAPQRCFWASTALSTPLIEVSSKKSKFQASGVRYPIIAHFRQTFPQLQSVAKGELSTHGTKQCARSNFSALKEPPP